MTIFLAIQEAADILSIGRPNNIVSSSDPTAQRLLTFAHAAGDDLCRRGDWSKLVKSATLTTGVLPADFERLASGGSVKRISPTQYQLRGPLSSDQIRAMPMLGATSVLGYGIQGGAMVFSRTLVGETIEADYISRNWLFNGATGVRRAVADTDTLAFPATLLTKGIIWRFKRQLAMNYQDELAEFEADIGFELKQDRGVTT
jgi:hypothetical protein